MAWHAHSAISWDNWGQPGSGVCDPVCFCGGGRGDNPAVPGIVKTCVLCARSAGTPPGAVGIGDLVLTLGMGQVAVSMFRVESHTLRHPPISRDRFLSSVFSRTYDAFWRRFLGAVFCKALCTTASLPPPIALQPFSKHPKMASCFSNLPYPFLCHSHQHPSPSSATHSFPFHVAPFSSGTSRGREGDTKLGFGPGRTCKKNSALPAVCFDLLLFPLAVLGFAFWHPMSRSKITTPAHCRVGAFGCLQPCNSSS